MKTNAYLALSVENFAHKCFKKLTDRLSTTSVPCFHRASRWRSIRTLLFPTQTFWRWNAINGHCIWRRYEIPIWIVRLSVISITIHCYGIRGARSLCMMLLPCQAHCNFSSLGSAWPRCNVGRTISNEVGMCTNFVDCYNRICAVWSAPTESTESLD